MTSQEEFDLWCTQQDIRKEKMEYWKRMSEKRYNRLDRAMGHLRQVRLGNCSLTLEKLDDEIEEYFIEKGNVPREILVLAMRHKVDYKYMISGVIMDSKFPRNSDQIEWIEEYERED